MINTREHNKQYHIPPEDVLKTISSTFEIVVMVTVYCILGFNPLIVTVLL